MTYNPGQFERVVPFLPEPPQWLILGGPADGDEAQTAARLFPGLRVLGVEPLRDACDWQAQNGWPGELLRAALWSTTGKVQIMHGRGENALRQSYVTEGVGSEYVKAVTLDQLDVDHGPFDKAVLWLDIEGAELEALRGGPRLLASGRVMLVNVEMSRERPKLAWEIHVLLKSHGFEFAHQWHWEVEPQDVSTAPYKDCVYVRRPGP